LTTPPFILKKSGNSALLEKEHQAHDQNEDSDHNGKHRMTDGKEKPGNNTG